MISRAIPALLALAAPAALATAEEPRVQLAQVTIHERIIIRVPRMRIARLPAGRVPIASPVTWKEKKGPACVPAARLAAVMIAAPSAIDLVLIGGQRVRAKLDRDCRSIDFYAGLYIRPGSDGQVCADRDVIRVRSGGSCAIDAFKLLQVAK